MTKIEVITEISIIAIILYKMGFDCIVEDQSLFVSSDIYELLDLDMLYV